MFNIKRFSSFLSFIHPTDDLKKHFVWMNFCGPTKISQNSNNSYTRKLIHIKLLRPFVIFTCTIDYFEYKISIIK